MRIFIDETGDHNLGSIDEQYPIFMLAALIITEENYSILDKKIYELKAKYFERPETFILHSAELKRPKNKKSDPRNVVMENSELRKSFYSDLDKIIEESELKIITCLIRKKELKWQYAYPQNPYYLCFENLLNRIIKHGDRSNLIYAEMRSSDLNNQLKAEYERLCKVGIHKYPPSIVTERTTLSLISKKDNVNGLQLIDIILSCIGRVYLGKSEKMPNNDLCYTPVIESKIIEETLFPARKLIL